MRTHTGRNQRGVALLVAMFALLLLSAIGMGMMFSANMETSIDANFRDKQIATYAALSGLQEARDRIQPASGDIASPADLPLSGSANIIYIVNPRSGETITPWDVSSSSKYPDTELCHESVLGLSGTADTPCTTIASGSGWYSSLDNSSSSYTGAYCASSNSCHCPAGGCVLTQPLLHKWVRIMLKADNMTSFGVNGTSSSGNQVCWNGTNQITRPGGYGPDCGPDGSITIQSFTGGTGYTSNPTVTISAPGAGGVQATATATVTITPTGQLSSITVTAPGNNYSANTQVSIIGGGGTGATALAIVGTAGGQVNSLTLNGAGTGCYGGPAAPSVNFIPTSGGAGATATSTLTGATCIYSISVGGSCAAQAGNLNVPFTVSGGGGGSFTGTIGFKNNGSIKSGTLAITNPGVGYTGTPTSWSVSGCGGLSITSATLGYKVQSLALTAGGNGYSSAPTVSIAVPPVGTTPTASATVTSGSGTPGQIMSVALTNPGSSYLFAPAVTFIDPLGTGSGGAAIASLATTGTVTAINLTNAGKGYTADPTITISGGGGSGSTVVGTIAHGFTYGQVFELTSFAQTPSGTRAMAQMEAVTPVRGFSVTGALTLDGPNPTFSPPNSLNMVVNGNDGNSCGGVAQAPHPSVGVYDDPNNPPPTGSQTADQYVTAQVDAAKPQNYVGANPAPDIENVFGSLGDTMGTPQGLAAFSNAVSAVAHANGTQYGNNPGSIAMGTAANPVIDFINGDVTLSGASTGYGILFVTGNLTFGGNFNWNGPVLVIGTGGFAQFNGGGNGLITGTVFVAKIYDSSGNLLPALGSPDVTWQGGGGNGIQYDHCWADNMLAKVPFTPPPSTKPLKVLSTRTVTY